MKKISHYLIISIMIVSLFQTSASVEYNSVLPSGLVVTMDTSHLDYYGDGHSTAIGLSTNLTVAGSTFNLIGQGDTYTIPTDTEVMLIPNSDVVWSEGDLTILNDWFTSDGKKLLWITGDSDYNGYFLHNNTNAILDNIGTQLRLASISIEDVENNDGAVYRVLATGTVSDGNVNGKLTEGVDTGIIMHGPTAIVAEVNDTIVNPLTEDIDGIEVVITSSSVGRAFDYDLSDLPEFGYDLYEGNGTWPMVGIEDMNNAHWVIVSGEAVFSDYKNMYGITTEKGGVHDGSVFVDNVLAWFAADGASDKINGDTTEDTTEGTPTDEPSLSLDSPTLDIPFAITSFFSGLVTLVIIKRKFAN